MIPASRYITRMLPAPQVLIDASTVCNKTMYINHSCEPNCVLELHVTAQGSRHLMIKTLRLIDAGEELTINYGVLKELKFQDNLTMCHCSSDHCPGYIELGGREPDLKTIVGCIVHAKTTGVVTLTKYMMAHSTTCYPSRYADPSDHTYIPVKESTYCQLCWYESRRAAEDVAKAYH